MNHEQLQAFLAVATEGTFSAAALALHKSQPAVSKLVRNLEEDLSISLLDRSAYRPVLTDAGKLFEERARELVESTESLRSFALTLSGRVEPEIRVVREAVTPLRRIIEVLRDVQHRYPGVRIELRTERMSGALEALHDRSAHLVITSNRGVESRSVESQPFGSVRIIPVVRHDHVLAQAARPAPSALLKQHPQVVLRDSGPSDQQHNLNILPGGLKWSVTDLVAKLEIIQAGMGWGGMPEHIVGRALAQGTLVQLQVREFDIDVIELFTMRRRAPVAGPVAAALWAGLQLPRARKEMPPAPRAKRQAKAAKKGRSKA
ncbi:MAG: transcriptional regulator, LysR family [Myxococcaceae bacterium]|nr:transcriptional regulator, LysR family [Myxococcaceae bacterium]